MEFYQKAIDDVATLGELDISSSMRLPENASDALTSLTEMIAFLIDHNFEKLMWILYRIDVDEQKAKLLLSQHVPDEAPKLLAMLILQREEKKQQIREEFQRKATDEEDEALLL